MGMVARIISFTPLILFLFMITQFSSAFQRSAIIRVRGSRSLQKIASSATAHSPLSKVLTPRATTTASTAQTSTMANIQHGVVMVLSPAKTMDLRPLSEREFDHDDINAESIFDINEHTKFGKEKCDTEKTNWICNQMKGKKKGELKSLLSLSDNLAGIAHGFWSDFSPDHTPSNAEDDYKPAIYTFSGPAFKGLGPSTCNEKTLLYLASNLFILDPVYGVLRSLQGMHPYRLEMGCKLIGDDSKTPIPLAPYWRESVTSYLGLELIKNASAEAMLKMTGNDSSSSEEEGPELLDDDWPILVNLASEEYSSSIDPATLPRNTIYLSVVFRHKGKVIAVHAKRARGLMARYLAEREASKLEDIAEFNSEGYECSRLLAGKSYEIMDQVGDNVYIVRMIFDREDAPPKETKTKRAGSKKGGNTKKKGKKS